MDLENIFRDVKLSKTEMTVLRFIQNDPEQCVREGIRAVAEHCYSNPSSLVRLAKKLKFSGWLELVYFIKFNITMPKLDVTNDIDYMSIQPAERIAPLLESLQHHRILIHGSGFSQLIAQYIYNKFLVTGVNA
ncbi:MAG: MurR/RpiR family transcriptional regulator, partial [Klebsiella sp.]|nr:MurR/RpiR family transcriptional regulator [Klebsiella sp.]